jgi:hypothetical protein
MKMRNPAFMRVNSFHSIDASSTIQRSKAFTEFSERLFSFPSSISNGRSLVRVLPCRLFGSPTATQESADCALCEHGFSEFHPVRAHPFFFRTPNAAFPPGGHR